jgi:uncharacterized membrane protein
MPQDRVQVSTHSLPLSPGSGEAHVGERNPAVTTVEKTARISSVDILRGAIMIIMALDHVRDYFSIAHFDPTDLARTTPALFFTRWITHFCAPVFVFLAGMGASLSLDRGKSRHEVSRFLWTRGAVLILLEFTVVRFGWLFNFGTQVLFVQVIWVLGVSMICLAGLIYLPRKITALLGIAMVVGHNAFDGIPPSAFGPLGVVWRFLHVSGAVSLPSGRVFITLYPLIPWIGVMALGFVAGGILQRSPDDRRRILVRTGGVMIAGFILLRAVNMYGDLIPWSSQADGLFTLLSFMNVTKYPPSLDFLLITLGPALIALSVMERMTGFVSKFLMVFGRVPMFFYIIHIYVIHALAVVAGIAMGFPARAMMDAMWGLPAEYGFDLPAVYAVWMVVIAVTYPLCSWYGGMKKRSSNKLLAYL